MTSSVRVLIADCGSTTTKALLFERTQDGWRLIDQGDAPTTVEAPVADVTVGVLNAVREIEATAKIALLASQTAYHETPFLCRDEHDPSIGIDAFLATSSAGGGLQMAVAGLVRSMSGESAQRSALGAGAIVLDVFAADDGREEHERIEALRDLRPDILLLSGGIDGGAEEQVVDMAETILAAAPEPRFGNSLSLPIIYAGNEACAPKVSALLGAHGHVEVVGNVRPTIEKEDLRPAREAIHEIFLSHVMSHSPGYGTLLKWTKVPILPTPAAVGHMMELYARRTGSQILAVDIGGATTDIFSMCRDSDDALVFHRSVSANLGMSYSIGYVLKEAGIAAITRWLPFSLSLQEIRHRLCNKMVRPTTLPQDYVELLLEQAVSREALRLSLEHHRSLAKGIGTSTKKKGIGDMFRQSRQRPELVDMKHIDLIIGAGGVVSHAPQRMSAFLMLLDGFAPEGITELAVDSVFMLPHLGILSQLDSAAATELLETSCLIPLGTACAPRFQGIKSGRQVASVTLADPQTTKVLGSATPIIAGRISRLPCDLHRDYVVTVTPANSRVDVGAGPGKQLSRTCRSGICGIILDGRNRPITHPADDAERMAMQQFTLRELELHFE